MKFPLTTLSLVSAGSALVLSGCASSPASFQPSRLSRVNLGMNKEEVVRALGRPAQAGTGQDGIEVFRYSELRRGSATNHYGVVFKGGQVVDYGPETGVRLGGQLAVQEVFGSSWMPNHTPGP